MPFGFSTLSSEVSLIVAIDGEGCTEESLMKYYGLFIWIPFAIYLMVGQFVICEEYFVPVLSQLGDRWKMAEDVQGATLLAIGSSSPELFTAVLGALLLPDENPGPGTNVGSAVFNMCVIIGLSAIFAPRVAKLAIVPFLRDSICYMLGIVILYIFYLDAVMDLYESILLVAWWAIYVVVVVRTDLLAVRCCCCVPTEEVQKVVELEPVAANKPEGDYVALGGQEAEDYDLLHRPSYNRTKSVITSRAGKRGVLYDEKGHPVADTDQNPDNIRIAPGTIAEDVIDEELQQLLDALNRKQRQNVNKGWMVVVVPTQQASGLGIASSTADDAVVRADVIGLNQAQRPNAHVYTRRRTLMETIEHEEAAAVAHHEEEEHGHGGGILHKMLYPWVKIFHWTLPRPEGEWVTKHIFATCFFIVIWLGILTFFVVDAATKIGACLTIPADLLGVTLLAIGSSLPDCISSVIVARQMKIDAAVANAFGSNIFDANLAVGFSFVLGSLNAAFDPEKSGLGVALGDEHAVQTFILLIISAAAYLVLYWLMMWCTIFRLERWIGYVLLVMYVAFVIVFSILFTGDEYMELEEEAAATSTTLIPTLSPISS